MVARVWIGFFLIALLCAFTFTVVHGAGPLVGADDDEFEDDVEPTQRPGVPLFPEKTQPSKTLQQADDAFDADEFEGITTKPVKVEEEPIAPEPVEPQLPPKPKFGPLEMCYIGFIVIFIGNYFYGKKTNETIATTWGKHFQGLFSNFNKFGENDKFIITKENAYTYTVTCSGGRPRCAGAVFTLDLNKRHDLSSYLTEILTPHKDTLTVDIAMYPNQPFSFVLAKKKEEKQVLKTYKDISTLILPVKTLPARLANYVAHTDSVEILDTILAREVVDVLATNEQYFYSIGYSDVSNTYIGQKTILRIVYRLPPVTEMKKLADLMRIIFPLIDAFASVSLTKNTLVKNENLRKKHNPEEKTEHEKRQELAQKKKQDRLQAERAAYDKMTPEAQRRFDEKEEKRKLKAKQGRVKVMYS